MRLLLVLAFVAFTGCHANVLRSEEPKPQLEVVKDAFWDYIAQAKQAAQDTVQTIRESEFGRQVNEKVEDGVKVARQYAAILQDQVSVIGHESYVKVSEQVDWLSERLQQDVKEVRAQLEPYTEELKEKVEQRLQEFKQNMLSLAESTPKEIASKAKFIQQKLAPFVEDLRENLSHYAQAIRSQITAIKESLQ